MGLSRGVLGASPAGADPEDKEAKDIAHALCANPEFQEFVAEEFGVKANRGQCQKVMRATFPF